MELAKIENTQLGFKWGDMEVIRMSEDFEGSYELKIIKGEQIHIVHASNDGSVVVSKVG